jgi:O-acetyl-ADP-ribose deacetylase
VTSSRERNMNNKVPTSLKDRIIIRQGDLTEMETDAIVNAANNDLVLGAGVAGAIRRKGGDQVQRECDAIGSVPVGFAAITTGGKLKAKYVIHAASMGLGGLTSADTLRRSTAHSLRLAAERRLKTIAFPAIGTGIARFPMQECAQIMLEEVARHLEVGTSLEAVYFVLFDEEGYETFTRTWKQMQSGTGKATAT